MIGNVIHLHCNGFEYDSDLLARSLQTDILEKSAYPNQGIATFNVIAFGVDARVAIDTFIAMQDEWEVQLKLTLIDPILSSSDLKVIQRSAISCPQLTKVLKCLRTLSILGGNLSFVPLYRGQSLATWQCALEQIFTAKKCRAIPGNIPLNASHIIYCGYEPMIDHKSASLNSIGRNIRKTPTTSYICCNKVRTAADLKPYLQATGCYR